MVTAVGKRRAAPTEVLAHSGSVGRGSRRCRTTGHLRPRRRLPRAPKDDYCLPLLLGRGPALVLIEESLWSAATTTLVDSSYTPSIHRSAQKNGCSAKFAYVRCGCDLGRREGCPVRREFPDVGKSRIAPVPNDCLNGNRF